MGFRACWLATRGKAPDEVLQQLSLNPTGEFEEVPEASFSRCELRDDWHLVWANNSAYLRDRTLRTLSQSCELVACHFNETVMACGASEWRNGKKIWSVEHDCQSGSAHLDVRGEPPEGFSRLRDKLLQKQLNDDNCDYVFDVPIELARQRVGFRYDMCDDSRSFEILASQNRPAIRWKFWQRDK